MEKPMRESEVIQTHEPINNVHFKNLHMSKFIISGIGGSGLLLFFSVILDIFNTNYLGFTLIDAKNVLSDAIFHWADQFQ